MNKLLCISLLMGSIMACAMEKNYLEENAASSQDHEALNEVKSYIRSMDSNVLLKIENDFEGKQGDAYNNMKKEIESRRDKVFDVDKTLESIHRYLKAEKQSRGLE